MPYRHYSSIVKAIQKPNRICNKSVCDQNSNAHSNLHFYYQVHLNLDVKTISTRTQELPQPEEVHLSEWLRFAHDGDGQINSSKHASHFQMLLPGFSHICSQCHHFCVWLNVINKCFLSICTQWHHWE